MLKYKILKAAEIVLIFLMALVPEFALPKESPSLKVLSWVIVVYCVVHLHLVKYFINKIESIQGGWPRLIVGLTCALLPFILLFILQNIVGTNTLTRYTEIVLYAFLYLVQAVALFSPAATNHKASSQ